MTDAPENNEQNPTPPAARKPLERRERSAFNSEGEIESLLLTSIKTFIREKSDPASFAESLNTKFQTKLDDALERWEDSEYLPTNKKQLKVFEKAQKETKSSTMWTGVGMGLMAGIVLAAMPAAVLGVATTAGVTIAGMAISGGVVSGLAALASVALAVGATYVGWKAGEKMGESAAKNLKPEKPTLDDIISAEDKKETTRDITMERAAEISEMLRKSLNRSIREGSLTPEQKESFLDYLVNLDMGDKNQNTMLNMINGNLAAELARTTQELDATFVSESDKKRAELESKIEEKQTDRVLKTLDREDKADESAKLIQQLQDKNTDQGARINDLVAGLKEMRQQLLEQQALNAQLVGAMRGYTGK